MSLENHKNHLSEIFSVEDSIPRPRPISGDQSISYQSEIMSRHMQTSLTGWSVKFMKLLDSNTMRRRHLIIVAHYLHSNSSCGFMLLL
jgi:hypothetical protein